jgi:hypothetical protein
MMQGYPGHSGTLMAPDRVGHSGTLFMDTVPHNRTLFKKYKISSIEIKLNYRQHILHVNGTTLVAPLLFCNNLTWCPLLI